MTLAVRDDLLQDGPIIQERLWSAYDNLAVDPYADGFESHPLRHVLAKRCNQVDKLKDAAMPLGKGWGACPGSQCPRPTLTPSPSTLTGTRPEGRGGKEKEKEKAVKIILRFVYVVAELVMFAISANCFFKGQIDYAALWLAASAYLAAQANGLVERERKRKKKSRARAIVQVMITDPKRNAARERLSR